jgi:hypothetical protein
MAPNRKDEPTFRIAPLGNNPGRSSSMRGGRIMAEKIHIAGISGSLRRGSWNTTLPRACMDLPPQDAAMELIGLQTIPLGLS